jgi:hypothetical protein
MQTKCPKRHTIMKNTISVYAIAVAATIGLGVMFPSQGAVIAGWDFNGLSSYGPSPFAPTNSEPGVTVVGLTRGTGIGTSGTAASNAWGGNDFQTTSLANAITGNDFATFDVTVGAGNTLSLSSISPYNIRRSSSGPTTGQWQYSINAGTFTDLGAPITWEQLLQRQEMASPRLI